MGQITIVDIILRILASMGVGLAVGAQRAHASHPAGIRTHMLVALGSCVVMITSCILFYETHTKFGTAPDPARLGAQVINGIGFLGAGAILREGFTVRGLTTAASVWSVACLGLAAGMGYYGLTLLGTAAVFVTLVALDGIRQRVRIGHRPELEMELECEHMGDVLVELNRQAELYSATLIDLSFERTKHNTYSISFRANFPVKGFETAQHEFLQHLAAAPGMTRMENHRDGV